MTTYSPDFTAKSVFPFAARSLYENRRWYKEKTAEIFHNIGNNYVDLWYEAPFYGKTDRFGKLYAPRKDKLNFSLNDNTVSFDFISDALGDMIFFLQRAQTQGALSNKLVSSINKFKIKRSFFDSRSVYFDYAFRTIEDYNEYIISRGLNVVDFKKYICEFLKFIELKNINFSYYFIFGGPFIPISATGLSLEFQTNNHDDDGLKNIFFRDPTFKKYVKIASNFGFRVNKNAPWMLIADLNSPSMRDSFNIVRNGQTTTMTGYMINRYIPDKDFLFENYYSRVISTSFDMMRNVLMRGYKKYQNDMIFIVKHGKVFFEADQHFKSVNYSLTKRSGWQAVNIETYKTSKSKSISSDLVELSDLASHPEFDQNFYLRHYERILKYEFSVKNNKKYKAFKKVFDSKLINDFGAIEIFDHLEDFYSATKIFDFFSQKPLWALKKNKLNNKKNDYMIPKDKVTPNLNKRVIEFFNDFSDV